ncbi:MAG: LytTR family transcriptional regulator [Oscillospiraceae bacterium]|nr:LytTR family transcriptional regulator [Oscillospiraceae bacterium]
MKIAYTSENPDELEYVGAFIRSYYDELHLHAEVCLFSDPEQLVESAQNTPYNLIMLNMDYINTNGVLLLYRIRRYLPNVPTVLIRCLENGEVMCILINPAIYILNDLSANSLKPLLDNVRINVGSRPERTILIRMTSSFQSVIPVKDIVYAECMKHRVFIHLASGGLIEAPGPIKLLYGTFSAHPEFLFPHRSYIVNAFYVSCITPDTLYLRMLNATIPIARGKYATVKKTYDSISTLFPQDGECLYTEQT